MKREAKERARLEAMLEPLKALDSINPRDAAERMLAMQMIGIHAAAMECLRRAMVEGQASAGRSENLKNAAGLSSLYARQMEALDKHRGQGRQEITVEHVDVHAGGQAIVGNVGGAAVKGSTASPSSLALENRSDEAMPLLDAKARVRSKAETYPIIARPWPPIIPVSSCRC